MISRDSIRFSHFGHKSRITDLFRNFGSYFGKEKKKKEETSAAYYCFIRILFSVYRSIGRRERGRGGQPLLLSTSIRATGRSFLDHTRP